MRVVRFFVAVVAAFLWSFVVWLLVLVTAPFDRRRNAVNGLGRLWTGLWKIILGVKVRVSGGENVRDGGPFLFVSNHASYLDVLALYDDFPVPVRFLAKKTLVWVPVFGLAFYTLDHVYIDRRRKDQYKESFEQLAKKIRAGKNVFIFPGGRRAADGRIGEWKKGAFVLAVQLKVPLVPVGIIGSARLHGIGDLAPRPGTIHIRIGQPIPTAGATYDDRERLLLQTRQAVEELIRHDPVE
jgi:1-acyl-sn-glycerol-3-phosphate acyltransferase